MLHACAFFLRDPGAIAQLGERLLCKQEVVGSIPSGSTSRAFRSFREFKLFARVFSLPMSSDEEVVLSEAERVV